MLKLTSFSDPLYKNSAFIILTSVLNGLAGFVFWTIGARLYTSEAIGINTALISSITLLVLFSRLGFDQSIIKFLPRENKSTIFTTSLVITTTLALFLGVIFIIGIDIWSPKLDVIKDYAAIYIICLFVNSGISITGISFVTLRKGEHYFIQNLIMNIKPIFLYPLMVLGSIGLFSSIVLACTIAFIFSLLCLNRMGIKLCGIDKAYLADSLQFSVVNYISTLFMTAPSLILPIMVLNLLGAEAAAQYYISYIIASVLFTISSAFSTSLFVEGSHGESLKKLVIRSLIAISSILIPSVVLLWVSGEYLLALMGDTYISSVNLLRIMALASLFIALCNIFLSIKRIQNDIKCLIIFSGLIFSLVLGLSYIFINTFGLIGVGYAWICGHAFCSIIIGLSVLKYMGFTHFRVVSH